MPTPAPALPPKENPIQPALAILMPTPAPSILTPSPAPTYNMPSGVLQPTPAPYYGDPLGITKQAPPPLPRKVSTSADNNKQPPPQPGRKLPAPPKGQQHINPNDASLL
jgi:hypothetical protein